MAARTDMTGLRQRHWLSGPSCLLRPALAGAVLLGAWTGSASAQSLAAPFGNQRRDAGAAVRIEANLLEVNQPRKQAIFIGNVIATRGSVTLRAARLVVHYTERKQRGGKTATRITRLDARDKVVVTSAGKRATGQWARLNLLTSKVTMGDAVVLTENKTVIRGSRLELDLKTGKSRLFGASTANRGGRVKSIFVPDPPRR